MNIHDRLKYLRENLKLTTRSFGASINMSGGSITNMEKGLRNITDRTIRDICREYNINPDWLIDGKEPMYKDVISDLKIEDEVKQLAKQYSLLSDNDKEIVKSLINSLSEKIELIKFNQQNLPNTYEIEPVDDEIQQMIGEYAEQLKLEQEKKAQ